MRPTLVKSIIRGKALRERAALFLAPLEMACLRAFVRQLGVLRLEVQPTGGMHRGSPRDDN